MKSVAIQRAIKRYLCSANTNSQQIRNRAYNGAGSLRVSEIFSTIQGEGPHVGRSSVFLRLGICNLSCVWCDTPYTWMFSEERLQKVEKRRSACLDSLSTRQVEKPFEKHQELTLRTIDQVYDEVLERTKGKISAVVITGGEPLLHKKPLHPLVDLFLNHGLDVEFETNGTISPLGLPETVHFNVSPKLSNSLEPKHVRLNFKVLQQFSLYPSSIFKFVVRDSADLREIEEILSVIKVSPDRVFLMPEGTVRSSNLSAESFIRLTIFNTNNNVY